MMRRAKDFRALARKALTGRYWWAVLASMIAMALGATSSNSPTSALPGVSFNFNAEHVQNMQDQFQASNIDPALLTVILTVLGGLLSVALLAGLALFLIGGAMELGYNSYNIRLYESAEQPALKELFSRFTIFGRALWLRVLMGLKIFAWSLLFIVPGIIASFRYAMAPYLMAENPELTASEAIEKSKAMMAGNKGRLFCLGFSFIGWCLLVPLTGGIGVIFLQPYMKAAYTAFYMDLSGKLPAAAAAQPAPAAAAPVEIPAAEAPASEGGPEQL